MRGNANRKPTRFWEAFERSGPHLINAPATQGSDELVSQRTHFSGFAAAIAEINRALLPAGTPFGFASFIPRCRMSAPVT